MIKYHKAYGENGNVVPIEDADRKEQYTCIGCGRQLLPVLGSRREHHFRHKEECECNHETYLHNYAKWYIKNRFDTQPGFKISYYQKVTCSLIENCLYRKVSNAECYRYEMKSFDLKKYYDTCELEVPYKGFVADVMLSSKEHPERRPVFIEIAVTHKCEEDKLNSGIKIIEITLPPDTDDLRQLNNLKDSRKEWEVSSNCIYPTLHKDGALIIFHNFAIESKEQIILNSYPYLAFFLNWNANPQLFTRDSACSEFGRKRFGDKSPFEIHFVYNIGYDLLLALAHNAGFKFPNCVFCHHHLHDKHDYERHLCDLCLNDSKKFIPSKAKDCSSYAYDPAIEKEIIGAYCRMLEVHRRYGYNTNIERMDYALLTSEGVALHNIEQDYTST